MPNRVHPRFNSQRDGILLKEREYPEVQLAFQFPTGWNSTLRRLCLMKFAGVSIPNGMEFYGYAWGGRQKMSGFQFPTGWNSTVRILQYRGDYFVSIPNGMEFYFRFSHSLSRRFRVSIPNGMEFYWSAAAYTR